MSADPGVLVAALRRIAEGSCDTPSQQIAREALESAPPPAVPDAVGVRFYVNDADVKTARKTFGYSPVQGFDGMVRISDLQKPGWSLFTNAVGTSIEPTPYPEPQVSNAGAPVMWICELFSEDGSLLERRIPEDRDRLPKFVPPGSTLKITPLFAALSTPEPQTGERDGKVERLTRERDEARRLAETFVTIDRENEADAFASKRRLAEVEERANAFLDAYDAEPEEDCWDTETGEEEPGAQKFASDWSWSDQHKRVQKACDALRAALRAKPEAQAIVGKEGDH